MAIGWVLIVDDDADLRGTMADLLRTEGYDVVEADNGQRALHALVTTRSRPCAILLDLMMPAMRGEALIEVLRDLDLLRDLPIIVATGGGTTRVRGARKVISKPFDLATLLNAIDACAEHPTRPDLALVPEAS